MVEDINEIDPGRLNKKGMFQRRIETRDEFGQKSIGYEDIFANKVSVEIIPVSGRELLAAQQIKGEVTHRIRCRFRHGLTFAVRFVYRNRIFDLQAVIDPREVGVMLEIMAKEGVTNG
ncbi:MAG TPA: phage head closure protein [Cellvibrio sp.]|nr:phage head closure protein [Cellvibrio sp.]